MKLEKPELNRTQTLGLILLAVSMFTYVGGWQWVLAYWDTSLVEEYRGYSIYYLPEILVYGIDTGGDVNTWKFAGSTEQARGLIDNWLDSPVFMEEYRGWSIYRESGGSQRAYAVKGDAKTSYWRYITDLREYVDALEGGEETPESSEEEPADTETGDTTEPEGTDTTETGDPAKTIGDVVEERKLLITAVSGFMGVGLVALGSLKEEKKR